MAKYRSYCFAGLFFALVSVQAIVNAPVYAQNQSHPAKPVTLEQLLSAPFAADLVAAKKANLRIVAQVPNDPQPLGIGFTKKNSGMVMAMNQVIAAMQQDGSLKRLKEKWDVP